jgi:hypothetical protein
MDESPRQQRISSMIRGFFIVLLISGYGLFLNYPQASFTAMFLVGAALQLAVIFLRKFLPAAHMPQVQSIFELIADAATVLSFALGIFGSIASFPESL